MQREVWLIAGVLVGSSWLMAEAKEPGPMPSAQPVAAASANKPAPEEAVPSAPVVSAADVEKAARQRRALEQLDSSQWSIELSPMSGERPKHTPTDTVSFSGGKISSEHLGKEGFGTSNFTLTVGDDAVPIWETMQTNDKQDTAFWRGEIHGEKVSGILSRHGADGTSHDFSFVGQPVGAAPAVTPPPAATPADSKSAPASTSTIPPAKKKKGWFR